MKILFAALLILLTTRSFSQHILSEVNLKRNHITTMGMKVLGGWGIVNTATGLIVSSSTLSEARYFHQMNAGWGIINTGLAVLGYLGAKKENSAGFGLSKTIGNQQNIEKILLLNSGMDVGYIAAGAWLNERGLRKNSDRLKGYGKSVILQGAFLLVFDGVLYAVHRRNGKKLDDLLEQVKLGGMANGVGIQITL